MLGDGRRALVKIYALVRVWELWWPSALADGSNHGSGMDPLVTLCDGWASRTLLRGLALYLERHVYWPILACLRHDHHAVKCGLAQFRAQPGATYVCM